MKHKKYQKIITFIMLLIPIVSHSSINQINTFYIGHTLNNKSNKVSQIGYERNLYSIAPKINFLASIEYNYLTTEKQRRDEFQKHNSWISVNPIFQLNTTENTYLKAGVGAAYMKELKYGNKRSGSHWQFAINASAGYKISKNTDIEFKWRHFSNGNTSKPNPGNDFFILSLNLNY